MGTLPPLRLDLQRHTLDNGLRVVLHPDRTLPLVALNLWYHVGSKNERPGHTGLAHLFEHLLFQGSEHIDTNGHFRHIQSAGGTTNGSTWYDRTNYHEVLPAHQLDLGLWLESERMGFSLPALTQDKLDNQRDVVINERKQRVDNQPYGRAFERLHELLYQDEHPYRWPVIGYVADLLETKLDEVHDFFSTYYAPNNAVLTLAGDFEPTAALEKVKRYFGDFQPAAAIPPVRLPATRLRGERRDTLEDRVRLPRTYWAYRVPSYGQSTWYAADLLATVLTGGKSSLLYEDLVYHRQLAQDVSAGVLPTEAESTFVIIVSARPEVALAEVEKVLAEHLARLATEGVEEERLERARNQLLTHHFDQLQALERRADLMSHFTTFFDRPEDVAHEADRYGHVSSDDLAALVRTYCTADQRARVAVLPEDTDLSQGTESA